MKKTTGREVDRLPECPRLNRQMITRITKTVFIKSCPRQADLLFIFGTDCNESWVDVANLMHQGLAPVVCIAGGVPNRLGTSTCAAIASRLIELGVPEGAIITEGRSQNTLQDAQFAKRRLRLARISFGRIIFACKAPHSRRCFLTLRKVFPDSILFPFLHQYSYHGQTITAQNWRKNKLSRKVVWGEYQRILLYSGRGDIAK